MKSVPVFGHYCFKLVRSAILTYDSTFSLIIYGQKETKAYYSAKGREEATARRIFDHFYPRQAEANPAATYHRWHEC